MRNSARLAILSALLFLPHNSFASAIDTVDSSDYGQQSNTACGAVFTDLAGSGARCFVSQFTTPEGFKQGYLVGYDSSVHDVDVTFSNLTDTPTAGSGRFGLVTCSIVFEDTCHNTPTWDLDIGNLFPSYAAAFSQTLGSHSITFHLTGAAPTGSTDPGSRGNGHQVAFLVLSDTPPTITVTTARPVCALALSYGAGTLNLGFTLQSPVATTWRGSIAYSGGVVELWSLQIPAVSPGAAFNVPLSGVPPIGLIGILTELSTPQGAMCFDWKTINTGP